MIMYLRGLKSPTIKGMSLLQMPLPKSKHSLDRTLITTCLLRSNTSMNPSKHILRSQHSLAYEHTIVKTETAKRIGVQTPSDTKNNPLRPIVLSKLSTPYPIPKAYVLERSEPIPTHRKLPIRAAANGLCSYRLTNRNFNIFWVCNHSRMWTSSSLLLFETLQRTITISSIEPWAVDLIKNSIDRRTLSQRNGPGKLAKVGVTDGPRNARVFGWSRSLKKKFWRERQNDHDELERNISALFGLFTTRNYSRPRNSYDRSWSSSLGFR
jgi:hypothetical protein